MATAKRCKTCHFSPCRCEDLEDGHMAYSNMPAGWPMVSDALAVHPTQAKEAFEDAQKKGVPTEFRKDGSPIFVDRNHKKRYCQAYGFFDRDAGYSDAQRGSWKGMTQKDVPSREIRNRFEGI